MSSRRLNYSKFLLSNYHNECQVATVQTFGRQAVPNHTANEEEAGLWSSVALSHVCLSIRNSFSNSGYGYLISQSQEGLYALYELF